MDVGSTSACLWGKITDWSTEDGWPRQKSFVMTSSQSHQLCLGVGFVEEGLVHLSSTWMKINFLFFPVVGTAQVGCFVSLQMLCSARGTTPSFGLFSLQ